MAVKADGISYQRPEIRQLDTIRQSAAQTICPKLINNNEKDIPRLRHVNSLKPEFNLRPHCPEQVN
ncbi:hypothetical protein [Ruegeria lacuscaerulensis]|uniref:hypothetical protein n=1 Tax=Ruegeria lacuscaerulensis TaxID=55218 RepID=UPI001F26AF85|nr:hypothetical protein [Ruegeria lacuscaerulensis]